MKRLLVFLIAMLMLLPGCSTSGSDSTTAGTSESKETTASSETNDQDEQVTLNVTMWDYTSLEYHSKLVKMFEEEHENVSINVIEAPANDYSDKVAVMLTGENDVDVVFIRDTASYVSMINKGQLMSLDELIASDSVDLSAYGGMAEQYAVNESIYGLPYRKDMWMLFYNKDLFDAANIPYPTDNMTMSEFVKETFLEHYSSSHM
jgi:multiple sugar transport system substrate-binding protein